MGFAHGHKHLTEHQLRFCVFAVAGGSFFGQLFCGHHIVQFQQHVDKKLAYFNGINIGCQSLLSRLPGLIQIARKTGHLACCSSTAVLSGYFSNRPRAFPARHPGCPVRFLLLPGLRKEERIRIGCDGCSKHLVGLVQLAEIHIAPAQQIMEILIVGRQLNEPFPKDCSTRVVT